MIKGEIEMADTNFTPEQHQIILDLIREELLEIFEQANRRGGGGSSSLGTSVSNMYVGKGKPTEYLVQVVRERMKRPKE